MYTLGGLHTATNQTSGTIKVSINMGPHPCSWKSAKQPKGFPSIGSLGSPLETDDHQHAIETSTYPSQFSIHLEEFWFNSAYSGASGGSTVLQNPLTEVRHRSGLILGLLQL
eukprot:Gb_00136 [translate_table: standard]